jgi:hypothetical protein
LTHYQSLTIDGTEHMLVQSFPPKQTAGDVVTVHCPLNGNGDQNAYDVRLGNVDLSW